MDKARLAELFSKGDEMTEDEKKEVQEAVREFGGAIEDVCRAHGLAYKAVLRITPDGIVPLLDVVRIVEAEAKEAKE